MTSEFEERLLALRDRTHAPNEPTPKPEVETMAQRVLPLLTRAGQALEGRIETKVIEEGEKMVIDLSWHNNTLDRGELIRLSVRAQSLAFIGSVSQYERLSEEQTRDEELLVTALLSTLEHPIPVPPAKS